MCCFNAARGFVGGARVHFISLLTPNQRFNAARGFVGGASKAALDEMPSLMVSMPHAALLVVQEVGFLDETKVPILFQCRTRLCWWCKELVTKIDENFVVFQCRTRLCWWCKIA